MGTRAVNTLLLAIFMGATAGALCFILAVLDLSRLLEMVMLFLMGAAMVLVLAWRTLRSRP